MTLEDLKEKCKEYANNYGCNPLIKKEDSQTKRNTNAVWRDNTKSDNDKTALYFGFIKEGQETSGPYADFCLVIFPSKDNDGPALVTLAVGSHGFNTDAEIARLPYWHRCVQKLLKSQQEILKEINKEIERPFFIKASFEDIQSEPDSELFSLLGDNDKVKDVYGKLVLAAAAIDTNQEETKSLEVLGQWIALYAQLREWPKTKGQKRENQEILSGLEQPQQDVISSVKDLLNKRKYVVLQGAPGVGKTYTAKEIAKNDYKEVIFTQFHAATTYSDFVYGIQPDISKDQLQYKATEGALYRAIKTAKDNPKGQVLLIIDEINRANLANVLGPVFYLFEPNAGYANFTIQVGGDMSLKKMPENLHVLATMNTADRSIAVVDFALRRRFAWYTILPQALKQLDFQKEAFDGIVAIFDKYASDTELDLQPGPSYFLANTDQEFNDRLKYELMPLIKEILEQGYMTNARNAFINYFLKYELEMFR